MEPVGKILPSHVDVVVFQRAMPPDPSLFHHCPETTLIMRVSPESSMLTMSPPFSPTRAPTSKFERVAALVTFNRLTSSLDVPA